MAGNLGALAGLVIFFMAETPFDVVWVPWKGIDKVLHGTFTPDKLMATGPCVMWKWPGMTERAFITGIRELDQALTYHAMEVCDPVPS